MKHVCSIFLALFLFSGLSILATPTVGSNTTSSRQLSSFFPESHTNNKMVGFSVFEKGLILENENTLCEFDAFFPLSGSVSLNGGYLSLLRDMILKSPLQLSAGTILGESFSIEFPNNVSSFDLPTRGHNRCLELVDRVDTGRYIYSVDWSFDNNYVAIVTSVKSNHDELQIFYVTDSNLTLTNSYNLNSSAYAVRWHPSDYYLAVGQSGSKDVELLYFDVATATISSTDSANIGTVYAVAWAPDGEHLAVGRQNSSSLLVYEVSGGTLGTSYSGSLGGSRRFLFNSLDWHKQNDFIAVGLSSSNIGGEVKVFTFDGLTLTDHAEAELSAHAYGISWHPQENILAVGSTVKSERLRLYEYDNVGGVLTEITTARTGEKRTVFGVDWSSDGNYLAASIDYGSSNHEIKAFSYDSLNKTLSFVSGCKTLDDPYDVAWSSDGLYVVSGDRDNYLSLMKFEERALVFDSVKLFFNSDINLIGELVFKGECIINGGGNSIDLSESTGVIVDKNASLLFEQAILKNISGAKIRCVGDGGIITLRDIVWIQDGVATFSMGALRLKNDVLMKGNTLFAYQSQKTSTLLAKSQLELDVGFTFSYDPTVVASKDLFEFTDDTSIMILNGATLHATMTGLHLKRGKIRVYKDSFISSEVGITADEDEINEGISLGDSTLINDCAIEIFSGTTLSCLEGSLYYKNVSADSWIMNTDSSIFYLYPNTRINLFETLLLGPGGVTLGNNATLAMVPGKQLVGTIRPLGNYIKMDIVGTTTSDLDL